MLRKIRKGVMITTALFFAVSCLSTINNGAFGLISAADAAGGKISGPNTTAPDRYVYYPGTEKLDSDEMRVTACGTGMPADTEASPTSSRLNTT